MSWEDPLPRKRRDGSSRDGWRWFAAMPGGTPGREPGRHREEPSGRGRAGAFWISGPSERPDRRHLRPERVSSRRPPRRCTRPGPAARGRRDDPSLPSEHPFAPTEHRTWQPVAGREDVPRARSTSSSRLCASERPHVVTRIDQQGYRPVRTDPPTARSEGRFVHGLAGCRARRASIVEAAEALSQVSAPRSWTTSAAGCCRGARVNGEREERGQLTWEAPSTEAPCLARPHSAVERRGGGGLASAEASCGAAGHASAEASGGGGDDRRLTAPDGPLRARGWDDETNRLLGDGSPGGSRRTR
jgi:hypothetical protein